ncbi:UNVERIFIED_CONTAM: hypothetical protein FKN15_006924 [Acipenser sinensis]
MPLRHASYIGEPILALVTAAASSLGELRRSPYAAARDERHTITNNMAEHILNNIAATTTNSMAVPILNKGRPTTPYYATSTPLWWRRDIGVRPTAEATPTGQRYDSKAEWQPYLLRDNNEDVPLEGPYNPSGKIGRSSSHIKIPSFDVDGSWEAFKA